MLLVASCYRSQAQAQSQGSTPGAVFSSEMICEGTIDRVIELLKLTNAGKTIFLLTYLLFQFFFLGQM